MKSGWSRDDITASSGRLPPAPGKNGFGYRPCDSPLAVRENGGSQDTGNPHYYCGLAPILEVLMLTNNEVMGWRCRSIKELPALSILRTQGPGLSIK